MGSLTNDSDVVTYRSCTKLHIQMVFHVVSFNTTRDHFQLYGKKFQISGHDLLYKSIPADPFVIFSCWHIPIWLSENWEKFYTLVLWRIIQISAVSCLPAWYRLFKFHSSILTLKNTDSECMWNSTFFLNLYVFNFLLHFTSSKYFDWLLAVPAWLLPDFPFSYQEIFNILPTLSALGLSHFRSSLSPPLCRTTLPSSSIGFFCRKYNTGGSRTLIISSASLNLSISN